MMNNIKNKLLVLDMDGVVNSEFLIRKWFNAKLLEFEDQFICEPELLRKAIRSAYAEEFCHSEELIFPQLAKRVTNIVKKTNCKILWSSTWRLLKRYQNIEDAKKMFDKRGLPGDSLIGYTPQLHMYDDGYRGSCIRTWLLNNTYGKFDKVAVLDDRIDAGYDLPEYCKFFQTTNTHGLTESIMKNIIDYLNDSVD